MNNSLKYIRKHKHWYERTINNINQCYVNKMLKKCNLCGKILNEPNIIYSDDTYEFVRGNISINKVNIDLLNNKEKKLFNKLIILFDMNYTHTKDVTVSCSAANSLQNSLKEIL